MWLTEEKKQKKQSQLFTVSGTRCAHPLWSEVYFPALKSGLLCDLLWPIVLTWLHNNLESKVGGLVLSPSLWNPAWTCGQAQPALGTQVRRPHRQWWGTPLSSPPPGSASPALAQPTTTGTWMSSSRTQRTSPLSPAPILHRILS